MKKLLIGILACSSLSAFASVGDVNDITSLQDNCIKNGGEVINGYLEENNTHLRVSPQLNACWFAKDGGEMVSLNTLSKQPTIAATYIMKVDSKGKNFPFGWDACEDLGGMDSAFYNNGRGAEFVDSANNKHYGSICTFGDTSFTSGWTILYDGAGIKTQARKAIISKPLNIPIPPINYEATSKK